MSAEAGWQYFLYQQGNGGKQENKVGDK